MFDIGWMELLLIGIVALIVVGPKDLPKLFRSVGHFMGKARGMAREFQRSMEQAADESGLKDATRELNAVNKLNLNSASGSARKYAEGLVTGKGKGSAGTRPGGSAAGSKEKTVPPGPEAATSEDHGVADADPTPSTGEGGEGQARR